MRVYPDSTIRVAHLETVELEPDGGYGVETAVLTSHGGLVTTIPLDDGALAFPKTPAPDAITIQWLASGSSAPVFTSYVEVVPRHYFELQQLECFEGGRDGFDELPDDVLWAARQAATDVFEEAAHRSFVERLGWTKDYGREPVLYLEHDVRELSTAGYTMDSDSVCRRMPGTPTPQWVEYTYGARYMPAEVSRAVLVLAAYMLRPSNRPIGATGESSDAGYIHFTTAGRDGATAIPEVNAAIQQFGAGERFVW